jgi:RNA-directed DNA polymerase
MYENLMEEVVEEENRNKAMEAVKRNQGAPGIDHMKTTELESHLQAHWEKIRAKLLAGTWVPSPVRRVEIPKPSGGTRMLGIPDFDQGEAHRTPCEPHSNMRRKGRTGWWI